MTGDAPAAATELAALPSEADRLRIGLPQLHEVFRSLVRAAAPPNPQFERERIIAQAGNPRELAFLFGLLSEGENEAALLLELITAIVAAEPETDVTHLVDEAWYYLRTSIDEAWQLDDGGPSVSAALAYLLIVCDGRLEAVRRSPPAPVMLSEDGEFARAELLRSLRAQFV